MKAKDSETRAVPRSGITILREKVTNSVNPSFAKKSMIVALIELNNDTVMKIMKA